MMLQDGRFKRNLKFGATSALETNISTLIQFDAIVNFTVDCLADNIEAMQTTQSCRRGSDTALKMSKNFGL